jgi:hypothetical protein
MVAVARAVGRDIVRNEAEQQPVNGLVKELA